MSHTMFNMVGVRAATVKRRDAYSIAVSCAAMQINSK